MKKSRRRVQRRRRRPRRKARSSTTSRARASSRRASRCSVSGTSPELYATLQYALQQRFGMNGIDYRTMLHDGLTPGDVTAATIVAADIKSTPESVIAEAKSSAIRRSSTSRTRTDARVAARDLHGPRLSRLHRRPRQRAAQGRRHARRDLNKLGL